jgi:hypothetical protein
LKPFNFGHPAVLQSGFADVAATWRWAHMSAHVSSLSSPLLSSLFSLLCRQPTPKPLAAPPLLTAAELKLAGRPHWPAAKLQLAPRWCWPVTVPGRSGVHPLLLVDVSSGGAGHDNTNRRAREHLLCLCTPALPLLI